MKIIIFSIIALIQIVFYLSDKSDESRIPLAGLVAYYPFEGNPLDNSGKNHHGVSKNISYVAGRTKQKKACYFDGNGFVSLPSSPFVLNTYSISLWIKVNQLPAEGDLYTLYSAGNNAGDQAIVLANKYILPESIGLGLATYLSPTQSIEAATHTLPKTNIWHHLVATRDNQNIRLYLNGKLITKSFSRGKNAYYANPVYVSIGRRANAVPNTGDFQSFQGIIDDIRIYNRVLKDNEILLLTNE